MAIDTKSVIGVDPGRAKCGIALVCANGQRRVERSVVSTAHLVAALAVIVRENPQVSVIVMGSGTGSRTLAPAVRTALPSVSVVTVDEKGTSVLARDRYLDEHPPSGWKRLLPKGLITPSEPFDDYAALILAERYLIDNA